VNCGLFYAIAVYAMVLLLLLGVLLFFGLVLNAALVLIIWVYSLAIG